MTDATCAAGRLRPATVRDLAFVRAAAGQPGNERFVIDELEEALKAHIASPDSALVIWEVGGSPEGFALFCELTNPASRAELRRLSLARPGNGLGLAFVCALRDHAFEGLGVDRLWLDVVTDNPRARHIYEKAGFVYEGTRRAHWRRPAGDVVGLDMFAVLRNEWANSAI